MPAVAPPDDTGLAHALALVDCGLRPVPIKPGGKHPPMKSWQHANADTATVTNWYKGLYRDHGVGLVMGPQTNGLYLIALDVDQHDPAHDGYEALHELEAVHGALPDTWRSITGSGGAHIVLNVPGGITVRNQQAGGNRIAPGIDVRGDGGQIVVAPTIHPNTLRAYAWEHGYEPWSIPVADCPAWLLELVREPPPIPPPGPAGPATGTVFDLHRDSWDWQAELGRHGWTLSHQDGGDTYWTRPGKAKRDGHSAVLHGHAGPLVVFTTDIPAHWTQAGTRTRDGTGWSFGPFGFYAATEHGGDRSRAARALHEAYGVDVGDLAGLIGTATPRQEPSDYDADLLGMLVDWHQFAVTDFKAEEWLWEPVIPAGRATAIFAKGGTGKSLITLRLVLDIVRAGVKVLYLDYEMTPDDLDDRLTDMGIDDPRELDGMLHYALLPSLPSADTPEGGKAINRLAELVDARLVVIDTFARAVEGDENDADTVRQFYRMTGLHLKSSGRGFVRIDHAGKDSTKGQRGTSAKNDDVDLVWELRRTETGYKMVRGKSRMGWVPESVNLDRSDHPLTLTVSGRDTYPVGTSETARLLDELGVDVEASRRTAGKALRDAGHNARNETILAALKYRRDRSSVLHFASDILATEGGLSGPQISGTTSPNEARGPLRGPLEAETTNPLVDDLGTTSGTTGDHLADASGDHWSPLYGDQGPSVPADDPDSPPARLEDYNL